MENLNTYLDEELEVWTLKITYCNSSFINT